MTGSELKSSQKPKLSPAGSRQKDHLLLGDDCEEGEEEEKNQSSLKLQLVLYKSAIAAYIE